MVPVELLSLDSLFADEFSLSLNMLVSFRLAAASVGIVDLALEATSPKKSSES